MKLTNQRIAWLNGFLKLSNYMFSIRDSLIITKRFHGLKVKNCEPIQVTVYIYMEMSQGNSVCSYLKQVKMSLFYFFFFLYRIGE
jgi:hypothetical protein